MDGPARRGTSPTDTVVELSQVWKDIGEDDETNVAVVTGAGKAFSVGGDFEMIDGLLGRPLK